MGDGVGGGGGTVVIWEKNGIKNARIDKDASAMAV